MMHPDFDQKKSEATADFIQKIPVSIHEVFLTTGYLLRMLCGEEAEISDEMDSVHNAPEPKK